MKEIICMSCDGTGIRSEPVYELRNGQYKLVYMTITCRQCGGSGKVTIPDKEWE